jgi:predicted RNA-binding Zn-ribbon protein involved in translation (DUF1610 family)
MSRDPGLYTDSTGEGMAGATDVSLETQRELGRTMYNGDKTCKACGMQIDPVQSLMNQDVCPSCSRRKKHSLVKGRMA